MTVIGQKDYKYITTKGKGTKGKDSKDKKGKRKERGNIV